MTSAMLSRPIRVISERRFGLPARRSPRAATATASQITFSTGTVPMMSAWLAENMLRAGDIVGAATAVQRGLDTAREAGITFYDAELYRLSAETLSCSVGHNADKSQAYVGVDEREELLKRAYSIAVAQEAKSLQLRAAVSLLRLATATQEINAAHDLLSETYAQFSEGFETHDLVEARTLLNSVRRRPTGVH